MNKRMKNKGFSLIELMIVVAILALMASIVFPVYSKLQERAKCAVALDNAQSIVTCLNAHNKSAKTDDSIEPIMGAAVDEFVTLSGVDSGGNAVDVIDTADLFNSICENKIPAISEEDFDNALEYIIILTPSDEFALKENYNHLG